MRELRYMRQFKKDLNQPKKLRVLNSILDMLRSVI